MGISLRKALVYIDPSCYKFRHMLCFVLVCVYLMNIYEGICPFTLAKLFVKRCNQRAREQKCSRNTFTRERRREYKAQLTF